RIAVDPDRAVAGTFSGRALAQIAGGTGMAELQREANRRLEEGNALQREANRRLEGLVVGA
ncbi:MAG: hypothetical protein ACKVS9_09445, partial [Phycisphaerae bacterium]